MKMQRIYTNNLFLPPSKLAKYFHNSSGCYPAAQLGKHSEVIPKFNDSPGSETWEKRNPKLELNSGMN